MLLGNFERTPSTDWIWQFGSRMRALRSVNVGISFNEQTANEGVEDTQITKISKALRKQFKLDTV